MEAPGWPSRHVSSQVYWRVSVSFQWNKITIANKTAGPAIREKA